MSKMSKSHAAFQTFTEMFWPGFKSPPWKSAKIVRIISWGRGVDREGRREYV